MCVKRKYCNYNLNDIAVKGFSGLWDNAYSSLCNYNILIHVDIDTKYYTIKF